MNENTKLKEWYTTNYPDDELGAEINPDATFQNLFDALDRYRDVYEVIGVGDSLVKKDCLRVWQRLPAMIIKSSMNNG